MHFLGLDIGSSSIKFAVINAETGICQHALQIPAAATEFAIDSPHPDWAEQDPELWWQAVCQGIQLLLHTHPALKTSIKAIGIAYQMHGLVIVDRNHKPVRPAIIWCDSRAVDTGNRAAQAMGVSWCMENLLNTPGNFTAAKLKWVADNEPEIYVLSPIENPEEHLNELLEIYYSGLSDVLAFFPRSADEYMKEYQKFIEKLGEEEAREKGRKKARSMWEGNINLKMKKCLLNH